MGCATSAGRRQLRWLHERRGRMPRHWSPSRSGDRRIRGEPRASIAVPVSLDAVATGLIAMHRRHVAQQAAARAVLEQMTSDLDEVARPDILALYAHLREPGRPGRFERPR